MVETAKNATEEQMATPRSVVSTTNVDVSISSNPEGSKYFDLALSMLQVRGTSSKASSWPYKFERATPDELRFEPAELSVLKGADRTTLTVFGAADFWSDGDTAVDIRIGPCKSNDANFDGLEGYPSIPEVTIINMDRPHPMITAVSPSTVHISGAQITVVGEQLRPGSRVDVDTPLGAVHVSAGAEHTNSSHRKKSHWGWDWSNISQSSYPIAVRLPAMRMLPRPKPSQL